MNNTLKRVALPIGAAVILGSSGFAFMASNSVPQTRAGDGSGEIAGYTVSNVSYDTNKAGRIGALRFTLDGPAKPSNVQARIGSGVYGGTENRNQPNGCELTGTPGTSTSWFCVQNPDDVTATLADAQSLRVLASQ